MKQLEVVAQCKADVRIKGFRFPRYGVCSRNAVKDGYCKQHHPDTIRERQEAVERNQKAKMEQRVRPYIAMSRLDEARRYLVTLGPPGTPLTSAQAHRLWKLLKPEL